MYLTLLEDVCLVKTGSREQYYVTMLTLFKLWRSGKDLKESPSQLWDEVFTHHEFSRCANKVMKFSTSAMNVIMLEMTFVHNEEL